MDVNQIFAVSSMVNGVTAIAFGLTVLIGGGRKNISNIIFFLFTVTLATWSTGYYFWLNAETYVNARFWVGILTFAATYLPILFYHWVTTVLELRRKVVLFVGYGLSMLCSLFAFSGIYVSSLVEIGGFHFWPQAGIGYTFYIVVLFVGLFLLGTIEVVRVILDKNNYQQRMRNIAKLILVVYILSWVAGATNFPLWYGVELLPYGNFLVFLYVLILSYAAFQYNLMHIRSSLILLIVNFIIIDSLIDLLSSDTVAEFIFGIFTVILLIFFSFLIIKTFKWEVNRKDDLQVMTDKLARANDELRKLDNAKSEFISIASHQLRTPLTAIKGYISLILEGSYGQVEPKLRDALNKVYLANERLIQLVEDLLNISRIESGRLEYKFDFYRMEDLVNELYDTFVLRARDKGLELTIKKPRKPLPAVEMDYSKIREVVSNLIDNAIKYTEEGSVTVIIEKHFNTVRVTVSDTGIGVPKELVSQLFEKFSRGKDTNRLHVEGTGLGLYVGRNLVDAHHGRMWVESGGSGRGAKFIVDIPLEQPREMPRHGALEGVSVGKMKGKKNKK